ncbi:hypothetical protein GGI64_002707 [Rhizobium leguminosarum]|uniref:Uncharacterized protein n=2 Tax=Rhizobium leguminosarum TaxID=384 RepID=A0ABF7QNY4_RHILW|nr:hypothetical protein [Rhizobium leguminosarum]ACI55953.1 conserved hypothetical protein [Rhizobium leguminosarum bv. trifolii WSM2304]NYJ11649.1 hypothetical protein [Rhizobium leguminosarum]
MIKLASIGTALALGIGAFAFASHANALTMQECSSKYKAAQAANSLNGMKWNDFRKAQCGTEAAAAPAAAAPAAGDAKSEEPTMANTDNASEPPATTTKAPKGVVFPTKVSSKYASESPGKARMHTCLDQYKADKANDSLNGLTWIKKGGGYYSICNSKLKS